MSSARCPVTGQVGRCPSMATACSSATSRVLPPGEQQATIWQSLLERNGHASRKLQDKMSHDSEPPPRLIRSSSTFLSNDGSDDGEDSVSADSTNGEPHPQPAVRTWPTYDQVSAHILVADYREILTNGIDLREHGQDNPKLLCPHGVVCQARIELFPAPAGQERYTGLLTPGTTVEHCLLRLSSALRPVDHGGGPWARAVARRTFGPKLGSSQILPAAALKCFRGGGVESGNLLLMGSKVGQAERDFFQHGLCTSMTEKIPALTVPFLRRFSRYSKHPFSLGMSDFCRHDGLGNETDRPKFPFALCLQPVVQTNEESGDEDDDDRPFDAFIEDVPREIAPGTHLYDVFVAPTPESVGDCRQLQRIGRVVSTSPFVYSSPTDGLTFRHQSKEDDLQIEEDWEHRMNNHILRAPDGTQGTPAKLTGWQIFEDNIKMSGDYVDFERGAAAAADLPKKKVSFATDSPAAQPWEPRLLDGWTFCGFQQVKVKLTD